MMTPLTVTPPTTLSVRIPEYAHADVALIVAIRDLLDNMHFDSLTDRQLIACLEAVVSTKRAAQMEEH